MSQNIDGALVWRAGLDIDDFNVSAEAMERRIRNVSNTAVSESERMDTAFSKAAAAFIGIVGVNQAAGFVKNMIQVRSEMQNTEASFKVFLGSAEKADLFFKKLQGYAYNNVFEFADLAKNASQLLAFRTDVEDVIPVIDKLSNIAAGVNAPLAEMVHLFNKAKANDKLLSVDIQMWESRGVPIVYELAKAYKKSEDEIRSMVSAGKIGFNELNTVITKLTDQGGMFAGMMVEKMKTLGDSIGMLQDNITNMFNSLGESNQGILKKGIDTASYLVEHYEEIGRLLGSLVIAYGAYKAAIIANSLATKGYTGVAILDNTVRQTKIALMKMGAKLSGEDVAITKKMEEAEKAHTLALQEKITLEQHEQALHKIKLDTINGLLTADQKRYLSNLGLTSSSKEYLQEAENVLSREQKMILSKQDLTTKSRAYSDTIADMAKKNENQVKALTKESEELSKRIPILEESKRAALADLEIARLENIEAQAGTNAKRKLTAERALATQTQRVEAATTELNTATKRQEKIQTDLNTISTRKGTAAGAADIVVKNAQTVSTNFLTAATNRLKLAFIALGQAFKANPFGWIITGIGLLISGFNLLKKKNNEVTDSAKEFEAQIKKEDVAVRNLVRVIENANQGTNVRKNAIEKLNKVLGEYNIELLKESATVDEVSKKYEELTRAIKASTAERLKAQEMEKIGEKQAKNEDNAFNKFSKGIKGIRDTQVHAGGTAGYYTTTTTPEWVKNVSDETMSLLQAKVKEEAETLKNLTGAEYTKAMSELTDKMLRTMDVAANNVPQATKFISSYMDSVISGMKAADKEAEKSAETWDKTIRIWDKPLKPDVDYATKSFSELDKEIIEIQKEMELLQKQADDGINVDVNMTTLNELLQKLGLIKSIISEKEQNLNTESGIAVRIKQLKDEREGVEINGKRYKELTKTINTLQNKLPDNSKNAGENALRKQEQLADKQLQADMRLEQARIDVMEEGYAKRKAQLDLQHNQNLEAIKKEERELAKARKEAGKGDLTKEEKQQFAERKSIETQKYDNDTRQLFNEEISYQKNQYQLYIRWRNALDKDAANTRFAKLLEGGASYKEWLEKQIAELKSQNFDDLATGDKDNLFTMQSQLDEINGKKSAMDNFKESISQSIAQATTLAEKIQAIADAKERLNNGDGFKLINEDDKSEATLILSEHDKDAQKELQNTVLNDYRAYEEKKLSIQKQYEMLRQEAIKSGNENALKEINRGESEALSKLNADMLMQTDEWKNLFSDLDSLSATEISNLVNTINSKMSDLSLTMDPAELKAILDRLQEAEHKIVEKNPFKALSNSYTQMIKSYKDLDEAKKKGLNGDDLKKFEQIAIQSAQNVANAIGSINDILGDVGNSLSKLASAFGKDELADDIAFATEMLSGLGQTAGGVAKLMAGDVIGGVKDVIGGIADTVTSIFNRGDKKKEKKIQEMQVEVEKLQRAYERLGRAISKTYSNDVFNLMDQQEEMLKQQRELIEKQIKAEKDKKKTDNGKIREWENQLEQIDNAIEDSKQKAMEMLAGTDVKSAIDEFADAIVDAYAKGENAAEALGNTTKKVLANAVKEALKKKFLADEIERAVNQLATAMEDGVLSDKEQADFENIVNAAGDKFAKSLEAYQKLFQDIDPDKIEDALTGGIKGVSEETASVLAGRVNAIVINQSDSISVMRQSLIYQQEIAANTRYNKNLEGIYETLKRIENKDNTLLSQGIS